MTRSLKMWSDLSLILTVPATIAMIEIVLGLKFKTVLSAWMGEATASSALFRDPTLSDDEKQARMAKASGAVLLGSLKLFAIIVLGVAGYLVIVAAGLLVLDGTLEGTVLRAAFQITSLIVAVIYMWGRKFVRR